MRERANETHMSTHTGTRRPFISTSRTFYLIINGGISKTLYSRHTHIATHTHHTTPQPPLAPPSHETALTIGLPTSSSDSEAGRVNEALLVIAVVVVVLCIVVAAPVVAGVAAVVAVVIIAAVSGACLAVLPIIRDIVPVPTPPPPPPPPVGSAPTQLQSLVTPSCCCCCVDVDDDVGDVVAVDRLAG